VGRINKLTEYGGDKEEDSKWQPDYKSELNIEVTILGSQVSGHTFERSINVWLLPS
jgi:hypothetical protein